MRPGRDLLGRAVEPGRLWLVAQDAPPPGGITIPVTDPEWLTRRVLGERVLLTDTRGAGRALAIVAHGRQAIAAELWDTT